jgi:hypothetical protein
MKSKYGYVTASISDEESKKLASVAKKEGRSIPKQAGKLLSLGLEAYLRGERLPDQPEAKR